MDARLDELPSWWRPGLSAGEAAFNTQKHVKCPGFASYMSLKRNSFQNME